MDFSAAWLAIPLQIFVVDLLLGADNALLIAVACNGLNRQDADGTEHDPARGKTEP